MSHKAIIFHLNNSIKGLQSFFITVQVVLNNTFDELGFNILIILFYIFIQVLLSFIEFFLINTTNCYIEVAFLHLFYVHCLTEVNQSFLIFF